MRQFGLPGVDLGFASWEKISFAQISTISEESPNTIIEFQIALHALWWLGKCVSEAWTRIDTSAARSTLSKYVPEIKKECLSVNSIGAKETTSQRTMVEAVLSVNRLKQMADETIQLFT
jgi:hypothetical protein